MRRRQLLTGLSLGLAVGLSGCSSGLTPDTGTGFTPAATPPDGDCTPAIDRRPAPESDRAKPYPAFPDRPTADEARTYARSFERAYQFNRRVPDYRSVQVELSNPEWAFSETDHGYVIGLDGRVQFDDPVTPTSTATALPSGFFEYSVWYYVTDRFALRGEPSDGSLEQGDRPGFAGAVVVACDSA